MSSALIFPCIDSELKKKAQEKGVTKFFQIWESFKEEKNIVQQNNEWTAFTVKDETFFRMIPMDVSDPFVSDPVIKEKTLKHSLVNTKIDPTKVIDGQTVVTLSGKSIKIEENNGKLKLNGINVIDSISSENSSVFILEEDLFVTSSDVIDGIERAHSKIECNSPFIK